MDDVPLVGGKTASLGEMYQHLTPLGLNIPTGFAVTAPAYRKALDDAGAWEAIGGLLDNLDVSDVEALQRAGTACRNIVYGAPMPAGVEGELREGWRKMVAECGEDLSVAVRSSATAEDLPTASFAGQHDTFLNVRGEEMLVDGKSRERSFYY